MCYNLSLMKKLLLFDFDGVIADSLEVFEDIVKKSLDFLGHNFIKKQADFLDLFRDNLYISLAKKNISPEDLGKLFADIESGVDFDSIKLYKGIIDAVKKIGDLADTAIVSSNREIQIEKVLKLNNAFNHFSLILGVNAGTSKIKKIKAAISHFNSRPSDTYYVVDTIGDLAEAKASQVNSIAVGWGWHKKDDLLGHSPDYFIETPYDLVKLVESLCQK